MMANHYPNDKLKIFSLNSNESLAKEVADEIGRPLGKCSVKRFSDGEIQINIEESIRGCDVFVIQSTSNPVNDNLMELLIMIDALMRASARTINVVMPYYGYARQDRKARSREPITAKLVANLLEKAGATRVIAVDLHAPQIQGFFDIPVDHLDSSAIFIPAIEELGLENLTFASPDVGSTNRVREVASYFNAEMVICDKHRKRANEIESMTVIGDVKGKNIVLIDDICDTAGTLCQAAAILKEKGALKVYAFTTHPVLSGKAYENIENSVLESLVVCDTIPLNKEKNTQKIKICSTAELFAIAIRNTFENKSINSLFLHNR